jgi:hypothetical protein
MTAQVFWPSIYRIISLLKQIGTRLSLPFRQHHIICWFTIKFSLQLEKIINIQLLKQAHIKVSIKFMHVLFKTIY